MSKSISQIEALISKAVRNAKTERELAVKGLNFGRWWNEVGELEKASKWITKYLTIYDKDAKAHKFLGEIYEKMNRSDAALSCYKNSLRVKQQQYELMLKVAEMHINPGPTQNPSRAQVWLDKAAVALPNNPQVYKLKMELYLAQEAPTSKLEDTILEELKKRPADPSLYVQYVSFLKDQERLDEAFAYALKTDHSNLLPKAVEKDLEWNQCLIDTCQEYAEKMCDDEVTTEGLQAYSLLLVSLCRHIWLCFEQEKYDEAMENLAMLDTSVFSALSLNQEVTGGGVDEWNTVLTESKGQLYWFTAIALIHSANQGDISWAEGTKLSAACYAVCLSFPAADLSETWASWSKDATFAERLKIMGGLRLSQSAHMMYNLASTSHTEHREEDAINEREWLRDVRDNFCTEEGRKKIFTILFGDTYNPETSMIYSDEKFANAGVQLIPEEDLSEYDSSAAPGIDLQNWVWMGIQWRQNFDNALDLFSWISVTFSDLDLAPTSSVKHGNVWNLYLLDVESFIVGCVLYAEKATALWKRSKTNVDNDALCESRLPLPLCKRLVTEKQSNWWDAACKLYYRKSREKIYNANQVKATLRHGIETIRGSGNHGLQLTLMAELAKHFAAKAYTIDKSGLGTSSAAWLAYQRRAAHYWTLALPLIQAVMNNRVRHGTEPKDKLFPNTLDDPTPQEARSLMSEVYMCNGGLLVQEGDLKRALETYGKAGTPHASFCEALIYKQLMENCDKGELSLTSSGNNKKKEAYMRKYTARLEVTLNRLQREPDEELLRRAEEMLHDQVTSSPTFIRTRESEPKRLFEETIPKRSPHVGNHTVNSEVDDSVLPGPSKQSTPKSEMRSESDYMPMEKGDAAQIVKNLSTLTSALSTMQINFMERLTKVEQTQSPKTDGDKKDDSALQSMCNQLEKLTTIVSGLQENKEGTNERERRMQMKINELEEQLSRSQIGTPMARSRTIQLTQQDGISPQSPLQVFDQYQQASLGQIGSPIHPGSPYYNVPGYPGYLTQSPAVAAMYAPQGYQIPQGMPPAYGQARMPQQVLDPRAVPSPVRTPPIHIRSQTPTNTGLPMSKEAADALSIRFQAGMGERSSSGILTPPTGTASPGVMPGPRPASAVSQPTVGMQTYDRSTLPGVTNMYDGRMIQTQSDPSISAQRELVPDLYSGATQQIQPGMAPRPQQPIFQPQTGATQTLDESYLPPSVTNTAQAQSGTSVLKSLLASGQPATGASPQPEIHYPNRYAFPEKKDEAGGSTWNFKFQTPEEMDKDNKKLEAAEEAEDAETSHNDTGPHFEPLVTLPEVEVVTGEENEEAVFNERAKLYRWHEGQWKERGVGTMKILKHKETGKYRLLMRRDQVLKICCNHIIGKSLDLRPMPRSDRAWMWHALDFSEDEGRQEGLAIRFKSPEIANQFREKFMEGQQANAKLSGETPPRPVVSKNVLPPVQSQKTILTPSLQQVVNPPAGMPKMTIAFPNPSGAALSLQAKIHGTPPKQTEPPKTEVAESHEEEEDAHNVTGDGPHFEPIIPLPDKVETKTGEEDEEILFCYRAKLYRYVDKQWKERGLGDMKILLNRETKKCRIVMRREQILKLCANHFITPEMRLARMPKSDTMWTWAAMDHSDPESQPTQEFLAVRFKLAETATEFGRIFDIAKDIVAGKSVTLTSTTKPAVSSTAIASTPTPTPASNVPPTTTSSGTWGSLVKKAPGSWSCPMCYTQNSKSNAKCPCCQHPNPNAPAVDTSNQATATAAQPTVKFSFGIPQSQSGTTYSFGVPPTTSDTSTPANNVTTSIFGTNKATGIFTPPQQPEQISSVPASAQVISSTGMLRAVKKAGTWSCPDCYSDNSGETTKCPCCGCANPAAPPEQAKENDSMSKPGLFSFGGNQKSTFSFGIPQSSTTEPLVKPAEPGTATAGNIFGGTPSTDDGSSAQPGTFSFGVSQPTKFSFGIPQSSNAPQPEEAKPGTGVVSPPKFSFGMPQGSYSFGLGPATSVGGNVNGNNSQQGNLFSPNIGMNYSKPSTQPTGESPKPRFPSVGQDDEEDEEYTDDSDETTESSDQDEEYKPRNDDLYKSPLNRQTQQQEETPSGESDDDVICLGEILPSEELQKRAESLMLPKHFYNFVKDGESYDDGETDSDEEKVQDSEKSENKPSVPSLVTSTPSTESSSSGFAALAAQSSGAFAFGGGSGGWVGMKSQKPLFANLKDHDTSQEGDENYQTEEKDNIHFEPVIKLPDKVETVTGEEEEETLYSQRCKLYRYNKPTNEWKERGVGDIKILKHCSTGRIRIVMRREQILKVCANHYIKPGMTLDPNKTSDRAWTWYAMDHSDDDGVPKLETFTARFKTVEIANEFKEKFDMCQTMLLDADPMTPYKGNSLRSQELAQKAEQMKNELRFFKDEFSKPSKVDLENTLTDETSVPQKPVPVGSLTPLVAQHAENLRKSEEAEKTNDESIIDTPQKPKSLLPGSSNFSFQMKTSEIQQQKETDSAQGREHTVSVSSDDPQAEKEIHFEPIISLPEKVDTLTGEEDEQVIFANRAKLYAFHKESKQWKERGIGDVKILQDLKTCKVRVLMRREQVFKVCLNHLLQPEIKLSFKDPNVAKTVMWTAKDYSDEEKPDGEISQFALRFKNSEFAASFKDLWEEGANAVISNTLLEPNPADINTSTVKAGVTSPGPVVQSPQSPENPIKPLSTFSFANVPSPFKTGGATEGPVNVMGFVFGKPANSDTSTPSAKFSFDTSKMSFAFGTSTPQAGTSSTPADIFKTPSQNMMDDKSAFQKNLFAADSDNTNQSNLFVTASETFTQSEQTSISDTDQTPTVQSQTESKDTAPQPLLGTGPMFGAVEKEYKPSPLAASSSLGKGGTTFATQSGKFQFKPTTSEPASEKVAEVKQDPSDVSEPAEEDDEVIFVSELTPTEDQRKRAAALLLPPIFFLHADQPGPKDYDEKAVEEYEEKILQFIEDRDSGKLDLEKQKAAQASGSGDQVSSGASKPEESQLNGSQRVFGSGATLGGGNLFGGNNDAQPSSGGGASFAALASGVQQVGFKKDPSFQFPGAGQVMFQQQISSEDTSDQDPTNFKCDAQFKPVLDEPPPLVEVKTGEEGEEVLFKERCKLYRYDTDAKAWKERGVGEIKILRNDEHKLHRVVMRRDQVFKVCTNHVISEKTKPEPHLGSTNACSYTILDYTESKTPRIEKIAIKFKKEEICREYMAKFEEIKKLEGQAS